MNGTMLLSTAAGHATHAAKMAGMSTGPAVKASAPGGTDVVCARRPKKLRDRAWNGSSSCLHRRHVSPVARDHACYGSVPPPPPCCWSPHGKLWCSRTPGVLLLLCCSGTGTSTCFVYRHAFTRGGNLGVL